MLCQPKPLRCSASQNELEAGLGPLLGKGWGSGGSRHPSPSLTEPEPFRIKGLALQPTGTQKAFNNGGVSRRGHSSHHSLMVSAPGRTKHCRQVLNSHMLHTKIYRSGSKSLSTLFQAILLVSEESRLEPKPIGFRNPQWVMPGHSEASQSWLSSSPLHSADERLRPGTCARSHSWVRTSGIFPFS